MFQAIEIGLVIGIVVGIVIFVKELTGFENHGTNYRIGGRESVINYENPFLEGLESQRNSSEFSFLKRAVVSTLWGVAGGIAVGTALYVFTLHSITPDEAPLYGAAGLAIGIAAGAINGICKCIYACLW